MSDLHFVLLIQVSKHLKQKRRTCPFHMLVLGSKCIYVSIHIDVDLFEVFVYRRFKVVIYALSQGSETYMEQPYAY